MLAIKALLAVGVVAAAAAAVEVVEVVGVPTEGPSPPAVSVQPAGESAGLPKMSCSRSAKNKAFVNHCIRTNFQALLPAIRNGGVLGLPNLTPYEVATQALDIKTLPISFHVELSNMTVHGLPDAIVRDARSDLRDDRLNMDVDLTFPKLMFKGLFEFTNGVFATWNFKGRGPFEFHLSNIRATWKVQGRKRPEDTHMMIDHVTPVLSYTIGGLKFWAKGLVDGAPALDDVVNLMVNRLWSDVVELGKPAVNKPLSQHLTALANDVFRSVPYQQLFPDSSEEP
ncbi:Putative beta-carotene-binding protein [Frankliniella fusca]|uniref:Beta-carotene-binding protein n=1 Tax=Frankliniella fusca TaxID=407009 RepID=A0AAE1H2I6_9NEOP|nr:Putative beta-carotene-binding protein [Frankliniella fusca]